MCGWLYQAVTQADWYQGWSQGMRNKKSNTFHKCHLAWSRTRKHPRCPYLFAGWNIDVVLSSAERRSGLICHMKYTVERRCCSEDSPKLRRRVMDWKMRWKYLTLFCNCRYFVSRNKPGDKPPMVFREFTRGYLLLGCCKLEPVNNGY